MRSAPRRAARWRARAAGSGRRCEQGAAARAAAGRGCGAGGDGRRQRPIVARALRRGPRGRLQAAVEFRLRDRGARPAAAGARRHALVLVADRPLRLLGRDLHALDQRGVLRLAPVRLHVAVAVGVEDAEFHRVHADEMRELVHLAFDREIDRRDAEAAHRGRGHAVGVDAIDVGMHVRDRVRPRDVRRAFDHRVARQPRIGAAVEIAAHLARRDAPVLHHGVLDVDALGAARRAELHLLLAAEHVAHRPPGEHRGERRERLGQRVDLAAEAAADRAADEVQLVRRHVEDLRRGVEREEQALRAGVDDEAVVRLRRGDRAVGLGRRMLDRRHLVALLQHVVGLREGLLDVAEAQLLVIVFAVILERVLRVGLVHHRRAGLERLLDVEHRRELLVIDAHFRQRLERLALAVRHDRDDRLALVADLVGRERRLVVLAEVQAGSAAC